MEKGMIFTEKQRFNQWWAWLLLIGINLTSLYLILSRAITGDLLVADAGTVAVLVMLLITVVLTWLFRSFCLLTRICDDGIRLRFTPLERTERLIRWEDITKCYFRQYRPLQEFGGWGIRTGSKGRAYTVYGKMGLQLELKDGGVLLIGTNRLGAMADFLLENNRLTEDRIVNHVFTK